MRIHFQKTLAVFSTLLLLTACGGGTSATFTDAERSFVKQLFLTEYLWYDQVDSGLDPYLYNTPQTLVNALRVDPPDRWSFTMSKEAYQKYSEQKTSGFGIGYRDDLRIFVVLIDSPAYNKLRRGDIIEKINGEAANTSLIHAASESLDTPTRFGIIRDGQAIEVSVTAQEYTHKVTLGKIIQQGADKVGYLRYDAFTSASVVEIEQAFDLFHTEDIDELVIDLRYNGGGSVDTAKRLLDNITDAYPSRRQIYLDWNVEYRSKNSAYFFESEAEQDGNELDMQRVFFLTTVHSASASELVINALKPYLGEANIITIGEHTHGKPVGMSARGYGSNYYFLINFMVKNDQEETVPFSGISPTCTAIDDDTHSMGDPEESMLNTALYYIEHTECPAVVQYNKKQWKISNTPLPIEGLWTTPIHVHD